MGITVSADISAWDAVGDDASDEAARGEGGGAPLLARPWEGRGGPSLPKTSC